MFYNFKWNIPHLLLQCSKAIDLKNTIKFYIYSEKRASDNHRHMWDLRYRQLPSHEDGNWLFLVTNDQS